MEFTLPHGHLTLAVPCGTYGRPLQDAAGGIADLSKFNGTWYTGRVPVRDAGALRAEPLYALATLYLATCGCAVKNKSQNTKHPPPHTHLYATIDAAGMEALSRELLAPEGGENLQESWLIA